MSSLFAQTSRDVDGHTGYRYRDVAADPVAPITGSYVRLGRRVERNGVIGLDDVATHAHDDEQHQWTLTSSFIPSRLPRTPS